MYAREWYKSGGGCGSDGVPQTEAPLCRKFVQLLHKGRHWPRKQTLLSIVRACAELKLTLTLNHPTIKYPNFQAKQPISLAMSIDTAAVAVGLSIDLSVLVIFGRQSDHLILGTLRTRLPHTAHGIC